MADSDIIFSADLNTGDFDASVDRAINKAGDFESALDDLQSSLDSLDTGINVEIEASLADNADIESLLELEGFDPEIEIAATLADATDVDNLLELDALEPDVDIAATLTDPEPIDKVNSLDGAEITPVVDAQETKESNEVVSAIDRLSRLKLIEISMQIAGNVMEVFNRIEAFTVAPFLNAEDAAANIAAKTRDMSDSAETYQKLIMDIQANDLGDSAGQIGEVIQTAISLKAPMEEASTAALGFTKVFDDQNPVDVLTTLNSLVESGLFDNFSDAGDALFGAFQDGANRGGDLLKVIQDNAILFQQLGVDGDGALSLITSGLDAGFNKASDVTGALKTFQTNLVAAADNPDSDTSKAFKTLGIANPAETGEEYGAEFVQSVIDAIKEQPAAAQAALAEAVFGKQGAIGTDALLNLNTTGLGETTGAIEEAGSTIDDTLRGAIDDFKLELQNIAMEFLSSEQIDLPGKLKAIKEGIQQVVEGLQNGETLGEAIELGFKIDGVDEFMTRFESIVGNLAIGFLEVVATIQDFLGKDSSGTRRTLANMAADQLEFDLKIANPEDIEEVVRTAIGRGVTGDKLLDSAQTVVGETAGSGDVSRANAIVDTIAQEFPQNSKSVMDKIVNPFDDAAIKALQSQITASSSQFYGSQSQSRAGEDDIDTYKKMKSAGDDASSAMSDLAEQNNIVNDALKKNKKAWEDADQVVSDFNETMADGTVTNEEASGAIDQAALASSDFAEALAIAVSNAQMMSGEIDTMTSKTNDVRSLASALQAANLAGLAVQSNLGTVPTGGGSSTTVTVNQNIAVNSEAEGASTAAQTANALRGF